MLYVNRIALGVIELKRSSVGISEGIRQNLDNQKKNFIRNFFTTMQMVMAGNDSQGLHYGTIETPESHYYQWKEAPPQLGEEALASSTSLTPMSLLDEAKASAPTSLLDQHIVILCNKARFLEIIHDFIVFDMGTDVSP